MASLKTGGKKVKSKETVPRTEKDDDHDLPLDYELNATLDKIGEKLTDRDLDRMKFYYSGEGGLGRRVQEAIKTPLQFFDQLKRSKHLDRHNLLYLQSLLWNINRKDLYKIFVDFARRCRKAPLHFYTNDEEGDDPDRSAVKFHISGMAIDRQQIQKLQGLVSKLLQIPEETIFMNGVKPFHSIVITFLIPTNAVATLKDLTSEEKGLLQQCDVDCVFIGEFKISLKGGKFDTPEKLKERDEIKKLLEWNKKLQKNLDDVQAQLIQKEEELERQRTARKTLDKSQADLRRSLSGSRFKVRRSSSHYDVLNEISLHLSDNDRDKLSEGYTFTAEEHSQLRENKHHILRVLIDKDIKVDIKNRVRELLEKLKDESILQNAEGYLERLSDMSIDFSEEPTFDEALDPDTPKIMAN